MTETAETPDPRPPTAEGKSDDETPTLRLGPAPDRQAPRKRGRFRPGDRIGDRYEVLRFIARGGMGEVYEVRDEELEERLALKMLQAQEAEIGLARERFRREIQLARRVTHRNICRLYDAGVHGTGEDAQQFCTMELLAGDTLHDHIAAHGPLTPDEVLPILRQLVEGLEAAHAQGIVHRDFKSGNVMLVPPSDTTGTAAPTGEDGAYRVVVTDFGLARTVSDEDAIFRTVHSEGLAGTIAFMAPEQLKEQNLSLATDLYALGVVLYHMLTGKLPHDSKTPAGTLMRRLGESAPSPRELVPELDPRWEAVVLRCMEKEPEDRFPSARSVLEALEAAAPARLPSRARQRKQLGLRLAGVAALALAGIAIWFLGPEPVVPLVADDPVQLTSNPGLEIDPTFSPDGRTLVHSADVGGGFELWSRPFVPGAESRQLTSDGGRNVQPAFSPDGAFLAFVSQERGGIWIMPAAGGPAHRATEVGSRPAWSPEGRFLAFQTDERKDLSERTLAAMPPSVLRWVAVDPATGRPTAEPESLTRPGEPTGGHGEPAWSPDGRRLAFSSGNRRRTQIWTLEVGSGRLEPLMSEARLNANPVYGPDGRSLFYIGISSQGRQSASFAVWRQPLDEDGAPVGGPERLTRTGLATIRQLALAPTGDRLVYAALSTVSALWRLDMDADRSPVGTPHLWSEQGQRTSRPAFSPDGSLVAFDRWQKGTNLDLWVREASGDERQVTVDPEWDSQAVFMPDGHSLAYFSERQNRRGLWRLDLETGSTGFLADIGTDADWARLSPAGTRIAYHSSKDSASLDIWIHDLETGADRRLTRDPELAGFPIWSPDGQTLAIEIRRQGSTQVAVLPADVGLPGGPGVDSLEQLTFEEGESWPYSWSPDGRSIAFAGRREGIWDLFTVDRENREIRRLTDEKSLEGYVRYPAWSPTGDYLLYERARTIGDLWLVDFGPATDSPSG